MTDEEKLEQLKKDIQEGLDSLDKGEGIPLDLAKMQTKTRRSLGARLDSKNTGRTIIRRDNNVNQQDNS